MNRACATRAEVEELIALGLESADDEVKTAWEEMCIEPQKWQCTPWGDENGGFWVVGEKDGYVVWYNDIEEGFNCSRFTIRGTIEHYACNQRSFAEFLLTLPEAEAAERWSDEEAARDVPLELRNGIAIIQRQTTYWKLRSTCGSLWRLHFKGKTESRFKCADIAPLQIVDVHPVLAQYSEQWFDLFIRETEPNLAAIKSEIADKIETESGGWRHIEEYGFNYRVLNNGHGLLIRGPEFVVSVVEEVLSTRGIKSSILKVHGQPRDVRAAVIGENFVIARRFRLEKYSP